MTIYDINPQEYNLRLADELKKVPEINKPEWIKFVKSSPSKKRPIDEDDFWYKRAASILRQIYIRGIVGVNRLKVRYGSKKNRGMKPERFMKSGGKIIRSILQQLDKVGFTEIVKKEDSIKTKKIGRRLTEKGKKFLEDIANGNKK